MKSGKWRWIDEPLDPLKTVQKLLLDRVLTPLYDPSPIAFGIKDRSQIDAARRHTRKPWVATADIEKFFAWARFLIAL